MQLITISFIDDIDRFVRLEAASSIYYQLAISHAGRDIDMCDIAMHFGDNTFID